MLLLKLDVQGGLLPGRELGQRRRTLFHGKIVKPEDDPAQRIAFQRVGGQRLARYHCGAQ